MAMTRLRTARDYWPRKADGLPPGQREVLSFPRFSDDPFRPPPDPTPPELRVVIPGGEPITIDVATWTGTEFEERTHDFHCVTTWCYRNVQWGGWPLRSLLEAAGVAVAEMPDYAKAAAADDHHAIFHTEDLLDDSVMVVTQLEGQALGPRHGGPLRLLCPKQYGYKSVKHLTDIVFSAAEPASSFGDKEHPRGRVALEERHRTKPNWMLRIAYRFVVVPTAVAGDRVLRKSLD